MLHILKQKKKKSMKENFKANIRTLTTELITRKYKEVKKNW